MKQIVLFGAGGTGKRLVHELQDKYKIKCLIDSDSSKWGTKCGDYWVENPDMILRENDFDYIIVASAPGYDAIMKKIFEYAIDEERIIDKYVAQTLESRRQFLEDWASLYGDLSGACAEVGVFEGDFAKYINEYFPEKKLYLFDTFEEFCELDITKEKELGTSEAKSGEYSNTSEKLVMGKMLHKSNVVIKKGYFPESADEVEDDFLFVNLDLDLYAPTLSGLNYFKERMVKNGVILVHDYFSNIFQGPKKAVDEFLDMNTQYTILPVGDGISVLIVGF